MQKKHWRLQLVDDILKNLFYLAVKIAEAMKKFLLIAAFACMMAACKKENDDPCEGITCDAGKRCVDGACIDECELDSWGALGFNNLTDDGYNCYINGSYIGYCTAYGFLYYDKKPADVNYALRAEQADGFIFTPTVYTGSVTLPECFVYRLILN